MTARDLAHITGLPLRKVEQLIPLARVRQLPRGIGWSATVKGFEYAGSCWSADLASAGLAMLAYLGANWSASSAAEAACCPLCGQRAQQQPRIRAVAA